MEVNEQSLQTPPEDIDDRQTPPEQNSPGDKRIQKNGNDPNCSHPPTPSHSPSTNDAKQQPQTMRSPEYESTETTFGSQLNSGDIGNISATILRREDAEKTPARDDRTQDDSSIEKTTSPPIAQDGSNLSVSSSNTDQAVEPNSKAHQNSNKLEEDDGFPSEGSDLDLWDHDYIPMRQMKMKLLESNPSYAGKRKKQALTRLKQHRDYTLLMEERVRILEKEVAVLLNKPDSDDDGEPRNADEDLPSTKPDILRLTWDEYKQARKTRKGQTEPFSIEALMEEPSIDYVFPSWVVDLDPDGQIDGKDQEFVLEDDACATEASTKPLADVF